MDDRGRVVFQNPRGGGARRRSGGGYLLIQFYKVHQNSKIAWFLLFGLFQERYN